MQRQKVRRQRDLRRVVVDREIRRHDVRIVRRVERDVREERMNCGISGVPMLLQKADRLVGEGLAGVLRREMRFADFAIRDIAQLRLHRVRHAAREHRARDLETAHERRVAIVPFAADEGGVAGARVGLRPRLGAEELLVDVEEVLAREQHRARGDAGRAVESALHVGAPKRDAAAHEPVEVRRLDDRIAERRDGVRAHVVGEEKEDVRLADKRGVCGARGGQWNQGEEGNSEERLHASRGEALKR